MKTRLPFTMRKVALSGATVGLILCAIFLIRPIRASLTDLLSFTNNIAEASSGGGLTYHTITMEQDGEGSVLVTPPGTSVTMPGNWTVVNGSTVQLLAVPATDYEFDHWEGSITGTENPKSILVNQAMTIRPVFLPIVRFATGTSSIDENNTPATITLTRRPAVRISTVNYTVTGTATSGADHSLANGQVTFPSLSVLQSINVPILNDTLDESIETVIITLSPASNVKVPAPGMHTLSINDDDPLPTVKFSGASSNVPEGTASHTVNITLSPASGRTVTIPFTIGSGTATGGGVDYSLNVVPITINPGQTVGTIPISIINDTVIDASETIVLDLGGSPTNATTTSPTTHTVNITDNDVLLTVNPISSEGGTVTRNPAGVSNGQPNQFVYQNPTEVTLTPVPNSGFGFKNWEGGVNDKTVPRVVTMDANKTVDAYFHQQFTLTTGIDPQSSGTGTVTPPTGPQWANEEVPVSASTNISNRFKQWTIDLTGTNPNSEILMDEDKTVKGLFVKRHRLTTTISGGPGTVSVTHQGDPELGPGPEWFDIDTQVTLTAHLPEPANGLRFKQWVDTATETTFATTPIVNIIMNEDRSLRAEFEQWYTLTTEVESDPWMGNITVVTPEGAGSGPVYEFPASTDITLRATWAGTRLDRWTINSLPQGNAPEITFDLGSDTVVKAHFVPVHYLSAGAQTLDKNDQVVPGGGYGGVVVPNSGYFDYDSVIELEAQTFAEHRFYRWVLDGVIMGPGWSPPYLSVTMDAPKTVIAQFKRLYYVDTDTFGTGTVQLSPSGLYLEGDIVTATATPAPGLVFDHWEVHDAGNYSEPPEVFEENPLPLEIDANKHVTTFFAEGRTLTVTIDPPGAGSVTPGSGVYSLNEIVTLSAEPTSGDFFFVTWSGQVDPDAIWTDADTMVVMDKDRAITAQFTERTGVSELDTFGDMEYFLAAINSANDLYTFDLNEISYDANAAPTFVANGIPDAIELHLLETVLRDPKLDLTARSGIGHKFAWEAWRANLLQIQNDAPNLDERIQRVAAGYMTLGDYMSVEFIQSRLSTYFQITGIDVENFDRSMSRYLSYDEDADNDGFLNNLEWKQSISTSWPERADIYVANALQPRQDNPLAPQVPLAPIDPNAHYLTHTIDCIPMQKVFLQAGWLYVPEYGEPLGTPHDSLRILAYPIFPDGETSATPIPNRSTYVELPVGTTLAMLATDAPEAGFGFTRWSAPGTLTHNSRDQAEAVTIPKLPTGQTFYVRALYQKPAIIIPTNDAAKTFDVTKKGRVTVEQGPGNQLIGGPHGSSAIIHAISHEPNVTYGSWGNSDLTVVGNYANPAEFRFYVYPGPSYTGGLYRPMGVFTNLITTNAGDSSGGVTVGGFGPVVYGGKIAGPPDKPFSFAAHPNDGYEFDHWSGHSSTNDSFTITSPPEGSVYTAQFKKKDEYSLVVSVKGEGSHIGGYIEILNAKKYYEPAEEVELTAHPYPGYEFDRWVGETGELGNGSRTILIQMLSDKRVQAIFRKTPPIDIDLAGFVKMDVFRTPAPLLWTNPLVVDYYSGDDRDFGEIGSSRYRLRVFDLDYFTDEASWLWGPERVTSRAYDGSDVQEKNPPDLSCGGLFRWEISGYPYCIEHSDEDIGWFDDHLNVSYERPNCREILVHFNVYIGPGCFFEAFEIAVAEIDLEATLSIKWTDDGVICKFYGAHDGFPWHELFVNDQAIYQYDVCENEADVWNLAAPMDVNVDLEFPLPQ